MSDPLETVHQAARQRLEHELHYRESLRAARKAGHTFEEIAEAAGVTRSAIYQILNRNGKGKP